MVHVVLPRSQGCQQLPCTATRAEAHESQCCQQLPLAAGEGTRQRARSSKRAGSCVATQQQLELVLAVLHSSSGHRL